MLGETHWNWDVDVQLVVGQLLSRFRSISVNTYESHPWPGWDRRSIDVWGSAGRGHAIKPRTGWEVVQFLRSLPGSPWIRHHIYLHQLWTSFGGYSRWRADDHAGALRHVHVTYWP